MPYARMDDRWDDHPKIRRAWRKSPAAVALHAMAITYCNRHNNDGVFPADWIEERLELMPGSNRERTKVMSLLFEVQLFEDLGEGRYRVHDFLEWNLSRAERAKLAERGRKGGNARSRGLSNGSSHGLSGGLSTSPSRGLSTPTPTPTVKTTEAKASVSSENGEKAPKASEEDKASDGDKANCRLLASLIAERNPKARVKNRDAWLRDMRLTRERDGNSSEEIERLVRWVFSDSCDDARFWAKQIQSPGNLREHFAALWGRMLESEKEPSRLRLVEHVETGAQLLARRLEKQSS